MHTLFQRNLPKLTEIVTWWDFTFYALYIIDGSSCVSDLSKQTAKAVSCKPSHETGRDGLTGKEGSLQEYTHCPDMLMHLFLLAFQFTRESLYQDISTRVTLDCFQVPLLYPKLSSSPPAIPVVSVDKILLHF